MERLPGIDAGYLYMETPTLHMHTLKVAVLDPSTVPGGYRFERFTEELARRLPLLAPFRRRLVEVPFGLHHPVWIDDPDFELDRHVHRVDAPGAERHRDLDAVIGRIASTPLRRDRPLWEMHVIEGLEGGAIAAVAKVHHSVADGMAAAALLANVMSTSAAADPLPSPPPWPGENPPASGRLLLDAAADWLQALRRLPRLVTWTLGRLRALARHRREPGPSATPPRPVVDAPRTSFNTALTPNRTFASASLPLADVKRVKQAFDVTVNDVVLAVTAGTLRRYLAARGEHLDRPLVAGIPIGTDPPGAEPRLAGNKVSNLFTSLRDDLADPVERLQAISAVTREAKVTQELLGAEMMESWVEYTPPRPFAFFMRQYSRFRVADRHRPPINLVVSNVPGPRGPLYAAGARLLAMYSVGPILEGVGLNVTVWSYLDRMHFSAIACPESVPDLHAITDGLAPALAELLAAAEVEDRAGSGPATVRQ